jgi:glycerol-3-phosphate dehydrogenase (NAD(P)+)
MKSAEINHIAVAGGGAWGTALALTAVRAGKTVSLWARESEVRASIRERCENNLFLPGVALQGIEVLDQPTDLTAADAILMAAPAQHVRATTALFAPALRPGQPVILCAKGLERGSAKLMTEVLAEAAPGARPADGGHAGSR